MPKVLLVEDDNNLREIFEMRLQADGYDTVTAADGEEGLTVAVKEKPDLIISDVMMPKLSGFEMVENLRSAPEMQNTKVIMMTALGQAEDKTRGEKLGVVKYLVKSQVTLEDFARVVSEVLGQKPDTGATPENQATVNKQESEKAMQEDPNSTNPAPATPPADAGAGGDSSAPVNPISGAPTDGSAGSEQQTTAQEQNAVQDQINNFAAGAPATPPADAGAPAPADPAAPAADPSAPASDGTYTPPATPPADAGAPAPADPAADSGTTPPAPADPGAGAI